MNDQGSASSGQGGFTLLELLIVLAIMSLASIVVMRATAKPPPTLSSQAAALLLASEFITARSDAIRDGSPTFVVIDLAKRQFWSNGKPNKRALPAGVRVTADSQSLILRGPRQVEIGFRSDGSTNGGRLLLDASGRRVAVSVDWLTGATRVDKTF